MKIYTRYYNLAFKTFEFPDGQPHFQLQTHDESPEVTIEARIKNPAELFMTCLAADVLHGRYQKVHLNIRYLMGARMDRRISEDEPFTLSVVGVTLRRWFDTIQILDPHSDIALELLHPSAPRSIFSVLPHGPIEQVLHALGPDVTIVIPDKGATARVRRLIPSANEAHVQILKHREPSTGKILSMEIQNPTRVGKSCLIVDDLCDGGATFMEAARLLRISGAEKVFLYVTHGIFSKSLPLPGIDTIFTTDSYHDWSKVPHSSVVCIPVSMQGQHL